MPSLPFDDFITCFRKQFIFQVGRGGRRISRYYTAKNSEQRLKNDQWAIMVFIYLGNQYGFSDEQLREELNISLRLYDFLGEEVLNVIKPSYPDRNLHKKVVCKIGLVKNYINCTHKELSFSL